MLLKRVVGLPGERIGFSGGFVTVNGKTLDEPYLLWPSKWDREPVELAPDEFFVVGDNRTMPMKDHTFGIAKRERILGKLML
jgi:signal peptidase I